ncbi:MAG: Rap1a/Tai family immunity protein [Gammaproteobacteria bacterium]
MLRPLLLALIIAPVAPVHLPGQQAGVPVHEGFITGNEYQEFSDLQKRRYVIGVLDGLLLAPLLAAPNAEVEWLGRCITGMTDTQVVAIVAKYLQQNPHRWHESMHVLVYSVFVTTCPRSETR